MVKFVTDAFSAEEADVIVLGIPLGEKSDITLQNIRKASRLVEPFDLEKRKNLLEGIKIADVGDYSSTTPSDILKNIKRIIDNKKIPLILGGQHTLTLFTIDALPAEAKIIVFDAHSDAKDSYLNSKFNHATWLRRAIEARGADNFVLIGVRSCDEDELSFLEKNKVKFFTSDQIKNETEKVKEKLREFLKDSSVYVSIDMDVFDPSVAPAVENPEPDGILYSHFVDLIESMKIKKIIGMDLVEIKSHVENRTTEFLAIKIIFQLLSRIKEIG
jgi:agmatinase